MQRSSRLYGRVAERFHQRALDHKEWRLQAVGLIHGQACNELGTSGIFGTSHDGELAA